MRSPSLGLRLVARLPSNDMNLSHDLKDKTNVVGLLPEHQTY